MDSLKGMIESIGRVRHFRNLKPADLYTIVNSGKIRKYAAGKIIFTQGEPCAGMFVLVQGRVHLTKLGPQGQVNIMSVIEPVIMFNEVAVLDGGPNPLTAFAVQDCLTWHIEQEAFKVLIERIPQIGLSLLGVLARRNREMISHYEDLSFRNVIARTAKLLLDLSDHSARKIQRRECSIEEMANRIATVPEAVSRSLNVLKERGLIQCNRTEIVIVSGEKLANLAQVEPQTGSM
jgi:CRP/FNR family transcriptional regulator, cyclic AMP receptor protein